MPGFLAASYTEDTSLLLELSFGVKSVTRKAAFICDYGCIELGEKHYRRRQAKTTGYFRWKQGPLYFC